MKPVYSQIVSENKIDSSNIDCYTYQSIIGSGNNQDTSYIEHCIERNAVIFVKGKQYTYRATIINTKKDTLSVSKVLLICSNDRHPDSPKNQIKAEMYFERTLNDSIMLNPISDNLRCCEWYDSIPVGITENSEKIWIHPIRLNQFSLTETAGFPDVRLPLEIGKEWVRNITIGSWGWGDWCNKNVLTYYSANSKKEYLINSKIIQCWEIESTSNIDDKVNKNTFLFNESLGFVSMKYEFHNGIKINFEMVEAL